MKKYNIFKKIILIIMIITQVLTPISVKASVVGGNFTIYSQIQVEVEERINELNTSLFQKGTSGYYTLLLDLAMVVEYSNLVLTVLEDENYFQFSNTTKENIFNNYSKIMTDFGEYYGTATPLIKTPIEFNDFSKLTFKDDLDKIVVMIRSNVSYHFIKYVTDLYTTVDTKYGDSTTEEDKTEVLNNYKYVIYSGDAVIQSYDNSSSSLKSFSDNLNSNSDTDLIGNEYYWLGDTSISINDGISVKDFLHSEKYVEMVDQIKSQFTLLISYAKEVDNTLNSNTNIVAVGDGDVDSILSLSNGIRTDEGIDTENGVEPSLNLMYLAAVASSAVYEPFSSYVGEESFTESLKHVVGESSSTEALKIYNSLKSLKKPLYYRSVNFLGNTTGDAKLSTLADLIDFIKEEKTTSFCTVKGDMTLDPTQGTWYYVPTKGTIRLQDEADLAEEGDTTSKYSSSSVDVVTNKDLLSDPVLVFTNEYNRKEDAMTFMLLSNIIKDTKNLSSIADKSRKFLYVNIFGDIVTEDNLVILPGAANPLYYNDKGAYNPYTVAFMNYYPKISPTHSTLTTVGNNVYDKYIYSDGYSGIADPLNEGLFKESRLDEVSEGSVTNTFESTNDFSILDVDYYTIIANYKIGTNPKYIGSEGDKEITFRPMITKLNSLQGVKDLVNSLTNLTTIKKGTQRDSIFIGTAFRSSNEEYNNTDILGFRKFDVDWGWLAKDKDIYTLTEINSVNINGTSLFPYNKSLDEEMSYTLSKFIAENAYKRLCEDYEGNQGNQGVMWDDFIFENLIINCSGGLIDVNSFVKAFYQDYEFFTGDSYSRLESLLIDFVNSAYSSVKDLKGAIGVQSMYTRPIIGKIFVVIQDNIILIMLLLAIILVFGFLKQKIDLVQFVFTNLITLASLYFLLVIVPAYLPIIYNVIIDNVTRYSSFETVATKSEEYDITYANEPIIDVNGNFKSNTTSITLYKFNNSDLKLILDSMGINNSDINYGNTYILNSESGMYLEGDAIKMNIDALFNTLPISGSFETVNESSVYQLNAVKTISNSVEYYTPYYYFINGFMGKINTLARVYRLPRVTTKYIGGDVKDTYLVNCYVNSLPFLNPENYYKKSEVIQVDEDKISVVETSDLSETELAIAETLFYSFGNNQDWLGISDFMLNLSDSDKESLWARTMQYNNFYDLDWKPNEDKINALIYSINFQTKDFVLGMYDMIGFVSDENMIKIISLYAISVFNVKVGDFGNWVYPISLNYEDIELGDVLQNIITSDYSKYVTMGEDVVGYIVEEQGIFNLIIFMVTLLFLFIMVNLINILVPTMYLLFCLLLVIKLFIGEAIGGLTKGFIKMSIIVFVTLTIFVSGITLFQSQNGSAYVIYELLALTFICLFVIISIIDSLIHSITDFGSTSLNNKLTSLADKLKLKPKIEHLKTSIKNITINRQNEVNRDSNVVPFRKKKKGFSDYSNNSFEDLPNGSEDRDDIF